MLSEDVNLEPSGDEDFDYEGLLESSFSKQLLHLSALSARTSKCRKTDLGINEYHGARCSRILREAGDS